VVTFRAFGFLGFEFVSDFELRISDFDSAVTQEAGTDDHLGLHPAQRRSNVVTFRAFGF
jgi:hypothetical protein